VRLSRKADITLPCGVLRIAVVFLFFSIHIAFSCNYSALDFLPIPRSNQGFVFVRLFCTVVRLYGDATLQ